jgi:CHAT domain-containing protein
VSNPTADLTLTEKMISRSRFRKVISFEGEKATRESVLSRICRYQYVHFGCHGSFNWGQINESGLILAGGDRLTLKDILRLDLKQTRLVFIAACETGMTDYRKSPDEFIGMATTFIQAGASGVISSLWPVSDVATALLANRFYYYHLDCSQPPDQALHKASQWLRQITVSEIHKFLMRFDLTMQASLAAKMLTRGSNECPFAHPFFWSAFTFIGA